MFVRRRVRDSEVSGRKFHSLMSSFLEKTLAAITFSSLLLSSDTDSS